MNHCIFGLTAGPRAASPERPRGREPSSLTLLSTSALSTNPVPAGRMSAKPERPSWSASTDVALIAILEAPLHPGETAALGFARKEAELRHVFVSLSVVESRALHARLSCPKDGDHLPKAFTRLTADRRARLINFIADARRREALAVNK